MDDQLKITSVPLEEITAEVLSLTCEEGEDGSLVLEWDEADPIAIRLGINDWSEERWNELLQDACKRAGVTCNEVSQLIATQPTEFAD